MILGLLKLIVVILFLYLTWRNLRDNYQDEKLVAYSWLSWLMFVLGGRVTYGLINWGIWNGQPVDWLLFWSKPGFNYWGGLGLIFLTTWWYCWKNDWKIWSFFEDITRLIYLLSAIMLTLEILEKGIVFQNLIYLTIVIIGYVIARLVAKKYRSMIWYKSGKKGFVFFFVNMIVCLLIAVAAVFFQEKIIAGIFSVLSLLFMIGLFILGEVFNSLLVFGQRRNSDKKGQ